MDEHEQENAPPAQIVTVVNENRSLRSPPFKPSSDAITAGKEWEEWLENIEREFRYFKITDPIDKCDAMIIYGGREIARLAKSLPDPGEVELTVYDKLQTKLNDYFTPKRNKHHARYLFLKMKQTSGETIVAYAARLREKATDCDFGEMLEDRILEHLIQTIDNQNLIQKAINKKWNLGQFLNEAGQIEDISMQIREMKTEESKVAQVKREKPRFQGNQGGWKPGKRTDQQKLCPPCQYCGLVGVHKPGENCPAYGKKCKNCQRFNHFAKMCQCIPRKPDKKKGDRQRPRQKGKNSSRRCEEKGTVKKAIEQESTSSDDEFCVKACNHLSVRKIGKTSFEETVEVRIGDVDMRLEPDSGAEVNLMDEHQFKALVHRSKENISLEKSRTKINTIQSDLSVKGEFYIVVRNKVRGVRAKFVVLKGHINSPPLLSRQTLEELGMLEIRRDGSFGEVNDLRIRDSEISHGVHKVESRPQDSIKEIVAKYKSVFEGIGLIRDIRNDKPIYGQFCMKLEAVPVAQKARHVPYYLQTPLKQWLEEGIEQGIFEEVPPNQPITWCSPLVVQPKPRYSNEEKMKSHMIRASVDLRIPNKYMERSRISQATVVEDFTYKFRDCKVFSKLDMRQGYHQLLLDPKSREIVTFSTPWGNMRPKRLVFGAKSSQDLFDQVVYRIFADIPKCLNQRDDILLGGRTLEEHNQVLETVLQRTKDFGITFNHEKCEFGVEQIEFYGYLFTKEGLKPTEEKVKAVKKCDPPKDKSAVRSFLGMIGYLQKFIPRYSALTAPLRELTHKDQKFRWGETEQKAFQTLKDSISSDDMIAYFNPEKPIIVRTEASFNEGLSAGLFQKTEKGNQPVHFISRTMTETEKKYSQTEKDALAVAWAKERFSMYLLGAPHFKIITAHKPLIPLFNRPTAKLPPRIEKWVMKMQDVDFEVKYEPGKDEADPMDFLSRHPLPIEGNDSTEKMIRSIVKTEHAIILEDIRKETLRDNQLTEVRKRIQIGDWEKYKKREDIAPFYMVRNELYVAEGVLFKMHQIIIPNCLQQKIVRAAHSMGHFGMSRTKNLLRSRYWFPKMNSVVENIIGSCYDCAVTTKEHRQEPVKIVDIPEKAWEVIAVDFGGPYPDGHYNLVAVDKRTRYPEVERVYSTSFKSTKEKLKKMFSTHGTPRRLESDNGPPFNSREFQGFALEEGFKHHRITPEHPRANGEAESFMKVLNKTEKIAHMEGRNGSEALSEMLTGYRSTPHPATGVSPYEALMNRTVRTKLDHPGTEMNCERRDSNMNEKDKNYKKRVKNAVENRNTREHEFAIGDYALLKQVKRNKWTTAYEPVCYIIYKISGSSVSARRITDGRQITRDSSHFKCVNSVVLEVGENVGSEMLPQDDNWREKVLMSSSPDENKKDQRQCQQTENTTPEKKMHVPVCHSPGTIQETIGNHDTPRPVMGERPKRLKQKPKYLKDYVC